MLKFLDLGAKRYTAKRNETASRNHTQHDRTQKRVKNSSLHNNNSSPNDTCPPPQLTRAKTEVYIITNSSYPHQEVPSDSLLLVPPLSRKLMLTKCRNNHHFITPSVLFPSGCSPGVKPFYYLFALLPVFLTAFPPPCQSLHSYIGNAFHKHAWKPYPICLTPQHFPGRLAKNKGDTGKAGKQHFQYSYSASHARIKNKK